MKRKRTKRTAKGSDYIVPILLFVICATLMLLADWQLVVGFVLVKMAQWSAEDLK